MSWNNGYERRKFEQAQKAQAKEYRKCGMNEEQIQAMYLQDLQEYRNNRVYAIHIPLRSSKVTARKVEMHCTKSSCFR